MRRTMAMDSEKDDPGIIADIERELENITEEDLINWTDDHSDNEETKEHISLDEENGISESLQQYMGLAQKQEEKWKQEIQECDNLLSHTEAALTTPRSVRLDIGDTNSDPEMLIRQVLNKLEKEEEVERQRVLEKATTLIETSSKTPTEGIKNILEQTEVYDISVKPSVCDGKERNNNYELHERKDFQHVEEEALTNLTMPADASVVAVMLDSDALEQNLYQKLRNWEQRRQTLEDKRQQDVEGRKNEEDRKTKELELQRKEKLEKLRQEQEELKQILQEKEEEVAKETDEISRTFNESINKQKAELETLSKKVKQEKEKLEKEKKERNDREERQRELAAARIQAAFKSLRVRYEIGGVLKAKREKRKEEQEKKRLQDIEEELERKKQFERMKIEQEKIMKEEEEMRKRREYELKKQREEEEQRLRQEEEQKMKIEEELKRQREEEMKKRQEDKERREREEAETQQREAKEKEEREIRRKKEEEFKKQKQEEVEIQRRKNKEEKERKKEEEIKKHQEEENQRMKEIERKKKKVPTATLR